MHQKESKKNYMQQKTKLVIPKQYYKNNSGTVEKLYKDPINLKYIKCQIYFAVCHMQCTGARDLIKENPRLLDFIDDFVLEQNIIDRKMDKLHMLHKLNTEFIIETAKQICSDPQLLVNIEGTGEYEITDYSFRGGVYHPEDIFMESSANRRAGYFKEYNVSFDPNVRSAGNKFRNEDGTGWDVNPYEIYRRNYSNDFNNAQSHSELTEIPKKKYF